MQPSRINQAHPPRPTFYLNALYNAGYTPDRTPQGHEIHYKTHLTVARSAEPGSDLAKAVAHDLRLKHPRTKTIQTNSRQTCNIRQMSTRQGALARTPPGEQAFPVYEAQDSGSDTDNYQHRSWLEILQEELAALIPQSELPAVPKQLEAQSNNQSWKGTNRTFQTQKSWI